MSDQTDEASIRVLTQRDLPALLRFLDLHADSSMFLRSNAAAVGLTDKGESRQGTYAALVRGSEVHGVVAHCWNGILLFQAPAPLDVAALARAAQQACRREVKGLIGPWTQIQSAKERLGLGEVPLQLSSREALYVLALDALRPPERIEDSRVHCRRARAADVETLTVMRRDFRVATNGETPTALLLEQARREAESATRGQTAFVLEDGSGTLLSTCAFNAVLPDSVQLGGVWTPEALRNRGYASAVVAGALMAAREDGRKRAILFTGESNAPARAVYERLGFQVAGDYGIIFFREGQQLGATGAGPSAARARASSGSEGAHPSSRAHRNGKL